MVYTDHQKSIDKAFRERNKERLALKHKLWRDSLSDEQKAALKERNRVWRANTKDKRNEYSKAYNKQWRLDHPEEAKQMYKKYHDKYRDKESAYRRNNLKLYAQKQKDYRVRHGAAFIQGQIKQSQLKKLYGLSIRDYFLMFDKQDLKCAICLKDIFPHHRDTHVDHDHVSGKVRGLLCSMCNPALGNLEPHMSRAISYLSIIA